MNKSAALLYLWQNGDFAALLFPLLCLGSFEFPPCKKCTIQIKLPCYDISPCKSHHIQLQSAVYIKPTGHAHTDLYGVRCLQVHLHRYPFSWHFTPITVAVCPRLPQLLVLTQSVPGVNREQVPSLVASLVLKTKAAGHGHRRHGRHKLGHFFESLGVDGVHVHQVTWKVLKPMTSMTLMKVYIWLMANGGWFGDLQINSCPDIHVKIEQHFKINVLRLCNLFQQHLNNYSVT